jgi:endogenous inhibitor of DNA gyrase (YacG/DUF329 family)
MPAKPKGGAGPGKAAAKGVAKKCPICGKPATEASHPFCSERCRDVDLNRWLSGSYVVPGREDDDEDAE